ncbi:MAG: hypothetical protein EP343_06300 [Deltaproteobacteria bacterium]|nr:MAG: hypothetical protein EP343_06300 [Deltaproteobacteria bacterium]
MWQLFGMDKKRVWLGAIACLWAGTLLAACNLAGYECYDNADCKTEQVCAQGWCKTPDQTVPTRREPPVSRSECTNGDQRSCSTDAATKTPKGICQAGQQTCKDGAWGSCEGEVLPATETCNQKDDDCDGSVDEDLDCGCEPKATKPCYTGASGTEDKGICKAGQQTCNSKREWGSCEGEVLPKTETCDNTDEDCDGQVDNVGGQALRRSCYTGPQSTGGQGRCAAGSQVCTNGVWGSCQGETLPQPEQCDNKIDDDCDGTVDEDCEKPTTCMPNALAGYLNDPFTTMVKQVAWTADQSRFVGVSDQSLLVWTYPNLQFERGILASQNISSMTLSPDSQYVAVAFDSNYVVEVFALQTGKKVATLKGHVQRISSLLFTPDSKTLITASSIDRDIVLWEMPSGKKLNSFNPYKSDSAFMYEFMKLDETGTYLFGLFKTQPKVYVWNLKTKKLKTVINSGCTRGFVGLGVRKDKLLLLCGLLTPQKEMAIEHWDWKNNTKSKSVTFQSTTSHDAMFSPDGSLVALFGLYSTETVLLDVDTGAKVASFSTMGSSRWNAVGLGFRDDNKEVFTSGSDQKLYLWDVNTQQSKPVALPTFQRHTGQMLSMVVSPKGTYAATSSYSKTVKLWKLSGQSNKPGTFVRDFTLDVGTSRALAFNAKETLLAAAGNDYVVKVWDVATGKLVHSFKKHSGQITHLVFHPDGKRLYSGSDGEKAVIEWSLDKDTFNRYIAHQNTLGSVDVHPSGKYLAVGREGAVDIYDLAQNKVTHTLNTSSKWVYAVQFLKDQKHLVVGHGTYDVWDWQAKTKLRTFGTYRDYVVRIPISLDESTIASFNSTGATLFDVKSGKSIGSLSNIEVYPYKIVAVAMGMKGNDLFTIANQGNIKTWACPVP